MSKNTRAQTVTHIFNKIKGMNKVTLSIITIIAISIVVAIIVVLVNISSPIDTSALKAQYETEGKKEQFIDDINRIQQKVSIKFMNSGITDEDALKLEIDKLNLEFKGKGKWKNLENMEASKMWKGSYILSENGKVQFKFDSKEIEPSWINDQDVVNVVILN